MGWLKRKRSTAALDYVDAALKYFSEAEQDAPAELRQAAAAALLAGGSAMLSVRCNGDGSAQTIVVVHGPEGEPPIHLHHRYYPAPARRQANTRH